MRWNFRREVPTAATNFAVILIDDQTSAYLSKAIANDAPRWPFSHLYHGKLVEELKQQGVAAVAFDVFFGTPDDRQQLRLRSGGTTTGQQFLANQLHEANNVILHVGQQSAADRAVQLPVTQLATNALAVGNAYAFSDRDGVIRRFPPFVDAPAQGRFWAMGFLLAAHRLGLDLRRAQVEASRLVLPGTNGVGREVPLNRKGDSYLDWGVYPDRKAPLSRQLQVVKFVDVFNCIRQRERGEVPFNLGLSNKLVVVGAGGTGVNLNDQGPTSLAKITLRCITHINVANALLTDRFVQRLPLPWERAVVFSFVLFATLAGWRLRTLWATIAVLVLAGVYVGLSFWVYAEHRYLLPVALPVVGALLATHLVMSIGREVEKADRRRLERLLKKVVSPKVIDALLEQAWRAPQTRRMEITVLFADLRGFTHFAEESQNRAEAIARELAMSSAEARALTDEAAREAMSSVNRYLAAAVDEIKATDGTLDKYMGDCVMAFWGAPIEESSHAAQALKCAAAIQQAVERINRANAAENDFHLAENKLRTQKRLPPRPMLPVLTLGVGVNSGLAIVGFMGSEEHLSSYTVFGHVVNVASRLEGLARGGQILLTEQAVLTAARNDARIMERCTRREALMLKGMTAEVNIFDFRWKDGSSVPTGKPPA